MGKSVYTENKFTWDAQKAILNLEKHGITFKEAATVFGDCDALEWEDLKHSAAEPRIKRMGATRSSRVVILIYTMRRTKNGTKEIRIIRARRVSGKERKAYSGHED
jgi:uncharacterized DUF497 family protein